MISIMKEIGFYRTSQVARFFGVTRCRVVQWIREGKLQAIKPGRDYFIPETAVQAFKRTKPTGRPKKCTTELNKSID